MTKTIINIGSINIDYVYRVSHFVQPGETLASQSLTKGLGGKGANQSVAIAAAGGLVHHVGCVSTSDQWAIDQLRTANVNVDGIDVSNQASGHAIIQVDASGENAILLHGGANQALSAATIESVLDQHSDAALVLLQNECNRLEECVAMAHARGIKVALNPAPMTDAISTLPLQLLDTLIVNQGEARMLAGRDALDEIIAELTQRFPTTRLVLTLGADGALIAHAGNVVKCAAQRVNAIDTTGAGDTFVGYFLAGIVAGLDNQQALERACLASAITVTRPGAISAIPSIADVDRFRDSLSK